jgi:hypothetical protein
MLLPCRVGCSQFPTATAIASLAATASNGYTVSRVTSACWEGCTLAGTFCSLHASPLKTEWCKRSVDVNRNWVYILRYSRIQWNENSRWTNHMFLFALDCIRTCRCYKIETECSKNRWMKYSERLHDCRLLYSKEESPRVCVHLPCLEGGQEAHERNQQWSNGGFTYE